ncbi:MAG: cysteine desulfurase [Candidatus Methanomethylophilaceae archaeon]|nr:cysteine desulfurase [Candidatus Methanomethylophilaceae archaeon]
MTKRRVYFDNSATTRMAPEVLESMMPFLTEEYGNPSSIHYMGNAAAAALRKARKQVADSLGCLPSEITFTSGGTESDNLALIGAAIACRDPSRKRIVTTAIEHEAVLEACEELKRRGFDITVLGVDREGYLDPSILDVAMGDDVCMVSVMAANNVIGTIEDISELSKVAHEHGALFHTDAVQGYTKMKIDVEKDGIDMLALSGHKIHAPKGIGALYVRNGTPIVPINYGGGQEKGLRSSTENVPGIVGLGTAAELAMSTMDEDIRKMTKLRDEIIDDMLGLDGVHLNGPTGERRLCNNTHFRFEGRKGLDNVIRLSNEGIAVSAASACSAGSTEPSYVLTALGLSPEQCMSALRISLSRYNTEDDVRYLAEVMRRI